MLLTIRKQSKAWNECPFWGMRLKKERILKIKNRLQPLWEMVAPTTPKELKQTRYLIAYYAISIINLSTKIEPLIDTNNFSMSDKDIAAFNLLKKEQGKIM